MNKKDIIMENKKKFKLNDYVYWNSQSQSYNKQKKGMIIQVVKPGESPYPGNLRVLGVGFGCPRNHESYLVKVENVAYWPLVKYLRKEKHNGK